MRRFYANICAVIMIEEKLETSQLLSEPPASSMHFLLDYRFILILLEFSLYFAGISMMLKFA